MTEFNHDGNGDEEVVVPQEFPVDDPRPSDRWEFVQVVHALVAAETEPEALGMAIGAFTQLSIRTERVDAHQLVVEFEEEPEAYLTRQWGPLPGTTRIDSGTGRRLLHLALERSNGGDSPDSDSSVVDPGPRICVRNRGRLSGVERTLCDIAATRTSRSGSSLQSRFTI